jgi:hypothetical protein
MTTEQTTSGASFTTGQWSPAEVCRNCGYCPCCGRGRMYQAPYTPYQATPYWHIPSVTYTGGAVNNPTQ